MERVVATKRGRLVPPRHPHVVLANHVSFVTAFPPQKLGEGGFIQVEPVIDAVWVNYVRLKPHCEGEAASVNGGAGGTLFR